MKQKTPRATTHLICLALAITLTGSCGGDPPPPAPPKDPARCILENLGEAADLVETGSIPDDQYITMQGISNPGSLVWRDEKTKKIYYATKLVGTQGRLFYMSELAPEEKPRLLADFTGTIRLWKNLSPGLSSSMKDAFKRDWKIDIDPEATYIIQGNTRPEGCK